jgi:hypothetical protein
MSSKKTKTKKPAIMPETEPVVTTGRTKCSPSPSRYVRPSGSRTTSAEAPELYERERVFQETFKDAGEELGRVLGHGDNEYFTRTLPEAILTFLDAADRQAVRVAVEVWLERQHAEYFSQSQKKGEGS